MIQIKKTKIVCTIGPKTESYEMTKKLIESGMDIARLNFSHGSYKEHLKRINNIKKISNKIKKKIYIILDTKGPEIRTKKLIKKEIFLKKGNIFTLLINSDVIGNDNFVSISNLNSIKNITKNSYILIDDGILTMKIIDFNEEKIICNLENSGFLEENKSIYIPGIENDLPILSIKDKSDILFGCKNKIDFLAISFVRNKFDIINIRNFLGIKYNNIKIISKIENIEGLKNIKEIINYSDAIMIARGDLGINIPIDEVIFAQKNIIKECNFYNKPVITATQMLESMTNNIRPTRAEVSDITNAIIDGTDAVMLSGESAKGNYPIESLNMMYSICCKTDSLLNLYKKESLNYNLENENIYLYIFYLLKKLNIKLVVLLDNNYELLIFIKNFFNNIIILCLSSEINFIRKIILFRNIFCLKINKNITKNSILTISKEYICRLKLINKKDLFIILNYSNKFNKNNWIYEF